MDYLKNRKLCIARILTGPVLATNALLWGLALSLNYGWFIQRFDLPPLNMWQFAGALIFLGLVREYWKPCVGKDFNGKEISLLWEIITIPVAFICGGYCLHLLESFFI